MQRFLVKLKELDCKSTVQFSVIESIMRRVRISNYISDSEILQMYQQINRFLQDQDSVVKLLFLMPNCRDNIVCIAQGLFSTNEDVERVATEILRKLEMTEVGRHCLANLNYFFMMKLHSNIYQKEVKPANS